jgi:hypothetical protein
MISNIHANCRFWDRLYTIVNLAVFVRSLVDRAPAPPAVLLIAAIKLSPKLIAPFLSLSIYK